MILYKTSFQHRHVKWKMACLTSSSIVVLINSEPTQFFKIQRGLKQGFELSPFLFILTIDSFSRGIKSKPRESSISGCRLSRGCNIFHLMFVDNILCVGENKLLEWKFFNRIFYDFEKACRLKINKVKNELITNYEDDLVSLDIVALFGVEIRAMSTQFEFQGCILKPSKYSSMD